MKPSTKAMCWSMFWWFAAAGTIEWSFDNSNFFYLGLFAVLGGVSMAIAVVMEET